jgi:UDPglucose 6-dehydrogenase
VKAFDPVGMEQAKGEPPNITYCEDAYSCAQGADAIVIVTEWTQMAQPIMVDLRNIWGCPGSC